MAVNRNTRAPKTTRIADDTSQDVPQTTDAGDAPADTYDPNERVSSAQTDKAAAAAAGHLTVNAVEPVESYTPATPSGSRTETITVYDADNKPVEVTYNYDTGETTPAAG